jgi:hypothetical protein
MQTTEKRERRLEAPQSPGCCTVDQIAVWRGATNSSEQAFAKPGQGRRRDLAVTRGERGERAGSWRMGWNARYFRMLRGFPEASRACADALGEG